MRSSPLMNITEASDSPLRKCRVMTDRRELRFQLDDDSESQCEEKNQYTQVIGES